MPSHLALPTLSATEGLLRHERWIVIGGLALITALAWVYLLTGVGMGMSPLDMTVISLFPHRLDGPQTMASMDVGCTPWSARYTVLMLTMWWVMMIAMMTPSAAPTILLYARVIRHGQQKGALEAIAVPAASFATGYLLSWLVFSLGATGSQWVLELSGAVSATKMWSHSAVFSGTLLLAAGLYQLSSLKHACLRHCRGPVQFLSAHWRRGRRGAIIMGLHHGFYCVGCCWFLMTLLFVGGVMNLLWIAGLAIIVLLEKLAPGGLSLARAFGLALVAAGLYVIATDVI